MALAERAELVARLSLKDEFSGKLGAATSKLKGMEGSLGRIAGHANRGLKNAATNLAKIGAVGGAFVGLQVRSGIQSLATLEDAVVSVDGAIKQVGKGWTITGAQIAEVANRIENDVERAFDDKEITQAATTLIRFGKVTQDNLEPALRVMTDLATKTGSVESASSLLAKALADPEKAAGKLARTGVILTKQQQKQITEMMKAGKVAEAQKVVLDALAKSTEGAAKASAGPYRDAMNILADVTEDAQRALAEGFLPLLQRVANEMSTFLADPKNIQRIRDFGKGLAEGFDKLLSMGKNIPWGLIGSSLETAGRGAKAVFDAFTGLPPWIQTAVITGWGLNKLTGGALGSIIGEGIKVTFGQFASRGASPANPLWVASASGAPGGVGGAAGGGKGGALAFLGMAGFAAALGGIVGTVISDLWTEMGPAPVSRDANGNVSTVNKGVVNRAAQPFDGMLNRPLRVYGKVEDQRGAIKWERIADNTRKTTDKTADVTTSVENMRGALAGRLQSAAQKQAAATERSRNAITARLRETKAATIAAEGRSRAAITSATRNGDSRIVTAIRNNRPIIRINVSMPTIRVSAGGTTAQRWFNGKLVPV